MLNVQNMSVEKGGAALLSCVSFELLAGQILGLIGPNGAGKSTLIKALLGELPVSTGAVFFAGQSLTASDAIKSLSLQQRACHMAYLPQMSALNFPYTVDEVVSLGRTPHSSGARVDRQITQAAMAAMDITYLTNRLYTELSGGEKQRTQLARVMAQVWRADDASPRLLILDEPTSALDLGHKQQLMAAIKRFARQGVAVLIIEHDLNILANTADSLLALQCGHSIAQGLTAVTLTANLIQTLFNARVSVLNHNGVINVVFDE